MSFRRLTFPQGTHCPPIPPSPLGAVLKLVPEAFAQSQGRPRTLRSSLQLQSSDQAQSYRPGSALVRAVFGQAVAVLAAAGWFPAVLASRRASDLPSAPDNRRASRLQSLPCPGKAQGRRLADLRARRAEGGPTQVSTQDGSGVWWARDSPTDRPRPADRDRAGGGIWPAGCYCE